ncbi:hypothetical protein CWR48_06130 [Oceanobacillus arenosus]|uniref:Uncharacterized protein n=1 Tax=Oceanobacillus arenosus TaxID=1229153 RepID=A0A3D8PYM5_9BACI|nr:hypothetical protein [Oceanobacillus arenosus]RDW20269.1 hypothetical protein CWR48_06130 [Oceanobacillus arenosus]
MKRKFLFSFSIIGTLALSIGLMTELESTVVLVKEQKESKISIIGQSAINNGDQYRVVTAAEQDMLEGYIKDKDRYIEITAEEQKMVEESKDLSGFVSQENGEGFYFEKRMPKY